jgi:hypothetical protein
MKIHSKFLIHWTGKKDIEYQHENIRAQNYVERLKDYYQNGLYSKRTTEVVIRRKKIKNLVRICFTEIRLSQAQSHADRYGRLGIGFSRDFIMNKGGRPVIYIPYKADVCLLEDSLRAAYDNSEKYEEIHKPLKWVLSFVKRMSDRNGDYYDEMEWRIVYDERPDNEHFTNGEEEGVYRLKFAPSDIKVLIFPNDEVKLCAFNDVLLKGLFSHHLPITVTLDDCGNF